MSKRKYLSGSQKEKNKQLKQQNIAKLPKITSIFKPTSTAAHAGPPRDLINTDVGEEEAGDGAATSTESPRAGPRSPRRRDAANSVDTNVGEEDGDGASTAPASPRSPRGRDAVQIDTDAREEVAGARCEDTPASRSPSPPTSTTPGPSASTAGPNTEDKSGTNTDNRSDNGTNQEEATHDVQQYPSDRANFPVDLTDADVKRSILSMGSCKPQGPFPMDKKQRRFSIEYYYKRSKRGCKIPRKWLCYSPKMDRAYCEPCWLFANRRCPSHQLAWTVGINDWQGLSAKIKTHESSNSHLAACVVFDNWKNERTVDAQLDHQYKNQVNFWTQVLKRIADVTLTLASCNLAFRAHREKIGEINSGNFLSIIELLARYDPVLQELLNRKRKVNYLSPAIQNELIALLSQEVHQQIVSEIMEAGIYSVIMDTTQDITKVDQLSQVFRYIKIRKDENDNAVAVDINESFLGFENITDQSAEGLEGKILELIENMGLSLEMCRGQGYDGASVMSGIYSGVQKRIIDKEPNAVYVHCAAHNLNLVLNDACQPVSEIKDYYDVIQRLYVFFSQSCKRWDMLENHFKSKRTLKRLCPTRWSSRHDAIHALRFRYADVLQALTKISLRSKKSDERAEATGLIKAIETFEFAMITVMEEKILQSVNIVSKLLQNTDMDIFRAADMLYWLP